MTQRFPFPMHPSSLQNANKAFGFIPGMPPIRHVLDVGGRSLETAKDRSYRALFPLARTYDVADIRPGLGVTLLMPGPYTIPLDDGAMDLVICGQTLEHVRNPFRLVTEMARVTRPGAHLILIAPSAGPEHDDPDCWRFLSGAFPAIAEECGLELIANWIDHGDSGGGRGAKWHDNTAVLRKP